jgi:phosphoglycerate dehydrogenase-like enzyme
VIFHDAFHTSPPGFEDCKYGSLDDLLSRSDIVSIHTNLTPDTHHLISERELRLMKATALIVNTSRGPVIDQAALAAALRSGDIAGAALDVLEQEPPDPGDALLDLPNVIVLPHVGSATTETRAAMLDLAVTNLIEALSGREPPACVNPEVLPLALHRRPRTTV